jgi:hypothetical protein
VHGHRNLGGLRGAGVPTARASARATGRKSCVTWCSWAMPDRGGCSRAGLLAAPRTPCGICALTRGSGNAPPVRESRTARQVSASAFKRNWPAESATGARRERTRRYVPRNPLPRGPVTE